MICGERVKNTKQIVGRQTYLCGVVLDHGSTGLDDFCTDEDSAEMIANIDGHRHALGMPPLPHSRCPRLNPDACTEDVRGFPY